MVLIDLSPSFLARLFRAPLNLFPYSSLFHLPNRLSSLLRSLVAKYSFNRFSVLFESFRTFGLPCFAVCG